jgi:hypothetical protein
MPKKKQPLVSEKPNNKEPDLGILSPERIEVLFGLAAEGEAQPSLPQLKSAKQIKQDRMAKARAVMQANRANRKSPVPQAPDKLEPLPPPKSEPKDWRYPIITPLLAILRGKKKPEVTVEPEKEKEVPGNGHKPEGATVALIGTQAIVPFKYEGWQPQEIPAAYRHMTPHWLWRRIHWEEQAKIALVKPSGFSTGL